MKKKKTRPLKNWSVSKCDRFLSRYAANAEMNPSGFRSLPKVNNSGRQINGGLKKKFFLDRVVDKIAQQERRI